MMRAAALSLIFVALGLAQEPVSFHKQLRPILARQCIGCHQGAAKQSDLSLETVKDIQTGGKKGAAFTPGAPEKSILISYLTGETKPQMPFGGKPLPDDQIELFRRWIREGAKDDSPAVPEVTLSTGPTVYHQPPVITAIAVSPDGKWLAVSGYREILLLKYGGDLVARLPGLSDRIHSIVFTPDGATLAAVGGSPARFGEVQIWDVATRKQTHSVVVATDTLFGAALSPDGSKLVCGGADKAVRLFDVATGKLIRKMDHHEEWSFGAIFGVNGKRMVSV